MTIKTKDHFVKSTSAVNISHKFFTRNGGASTGRFTSLNFTKKFGDSSININKNTEVVAGTFQLEKNAVRLVNQVHGKEVVTIDKSNYNSDLSDFKADAMVTSLPKIILGIVTADCCPILLMDSEAKVIGAAHAGWRGAFSGIIESTVKSMEKLGASKSNIKSAIGPSIAWDSYEVDTAFKMAFEAQYSGNSEFFKPSNNQNHYMFNLKGYVKQKLIEAGVNDIDDVGIDTYSMEEDFFSCRRAYHKGENGFGVQMSAICLF